MADARYGRSLAQGGPLLDPHRCVDQAEAAKMGIAHHHDRASVGRLPCEVWAKGLAGEAAVRGRDALQGFDVTVGKTCFCHKWVFTQ